MRKQGTTNEINEIKILDSCGMAVCLNVIGGRWKPAILCRLVYGKMRYSELKNSIDGISERMLVAQLREMEKDGIVKRIIYPEVPPRVEYELTEMGSSLQPVLKLMSEWGNHHKGKAIVQKANGN